MACIPVVDPTCNPVSDLVTDGATAVLNSLGISTSDAAAWAVKTMVTGWLMVPSPIIKNQDTVNHLRSYTYWYVGAIAVFSLLIAAGRMALQGKGQAAKDALAGLVKLILVTSLAVPITIGLTEAGDAYTRWIINASTSGHLGERVLLFAPNGHVEGITAIVTIAVGFICMVVAMVQMLLSIAVGGLKIFLCGIAPIPAAANIAGGGKTTLARYLSWLLAALLYKPAAGTIYAMAFWMIGDGTSFTTVLTGIVVIAAALVAMPALLRLLAPVTAQMAGGGGGGGGAMAGAAAGGVGNIATGAVRMAGTRGGSAAGGGSPGGSTGGTPPQRSPAAIGPGGGGSAGAGGGAAGGGAGAGGSAAGGAAVPVGAAGGGASSGAAAGGGAAAGAGGGAAAGAGGGAAAGGAAAGGAVAAAGPVGAAVAVGAAAAKAGPAAVRKVGGLAGGAAGGGEQQ
jgi:type IV secretion system protein TrbL